MDSLSGTQTDSEGCRMIKATSWQVTMSGVLMWAGGQY